MKIFFAWHPKQCEIFSVYIHPLISMKTEKLLETGEMGLTETNIGQHTQLLCMENGNEGYKLN